jgi:hypothetical protein
MSFSSFEQAILSSYSLPPFFCEFISSLLYFLFNSYNFASIHPRFPNSITPDFWCFPLSIFLEESCFVHVPPRDPEVFECYNRSDRVLRHVERRMLKLEARRLWRISRLLKGLGVDDIVNEEVNNRTPWVRKGEIKPLYVNKFRVNGDRPPGISSGLYASLLLSSKSKARCSVKQKKCNKNMDDDEEENFRLKLSSESKARCSVKRKNYGKNMDDDDEENFRLKLSTESKPRSTKQKNYGKNMDDDEEKVFRLKSCVNEEDVLRLKGVCEGGDGCCNNNNNH